MKILITGANGQLGECLQDRLEQTDYEVIAMNRRSLDVTDAAQISNLFKFYNPDIVINAAAYTAVDLAESEQSIAFSINEFGSRNLALACREKNIPLMHISTDYVFDGTASTPYHEENVPNPQSVYGKSKLAGEIAIKESQATYCIVRTAWVFSEYGNNFLKTMLRLASDRDEINIVSDQYGAPTYAGDLAEALIVLIPSVIKPNFESHVLHYNGDESCNWFEFASEIFRHAKSLGVVDKELKLNPITAKKYPTAAARPVYSVLDCARIKQQYNVEASNWETAIPIVIQKIIEKQNLI